MSFDKRLVLLKEFARRHCRPLPGAAARYVIIFSVSDGVDRAETFHAVAQNFDLAWKSGRRLMRDRMRRARLSGRHLRVDWVESSVPVRWGEFQRLVASVKRTYLRFGFALDEGFTHLLSEMECHANAIYYGGSDKRNGEFNARNFNVYAKRRFGAAPALPDSPETPVQVVGTAGAYCGPDNKIHHQPGPLPANLDIVSQGLYCGHREISKLTPELLRTAVGAASRWLENQIRPDGKFVYGYFPCFGREIAAYNSLRHASSLYSLLDVAPFVGGRSLIRSATRGLAYLANSLIRHYEPEPGKPMAFVVEDSAKEIKLGANGVALLAYAKHRELTGSGEYDRLMGLLAEGIAFMRDPENGHFVHVLDSETLAVKEPFRIIYYDGEAVFSLLRFYGQSEDPRWLTIAREAFEGFLGSEKHQTANDHWLSYAANEIFTHMPDERYLEFGVNNCMPHLDFILSRETSFPTLLELLMAAQKLFAKAGAAGASCLPGPAGMEKFRRAVHYRAHYLLNGYFWPETAMFFKNPDRVAETFFIRHQAFRTRIDDAQHYLSGLAAYGSLLESGDPGWAAPEDARVLGTRYSGLGA